jgi:hypothetical protein
MGAVSILRGGLTLELSPWFRGSGDTIPGDTLVPGTPYLIPRVPGTPYLIPRVPGTPYLVPGTPYLIPRRSGRVRWTSVFRGQCSGDTIPNSAAIGAGSVDVRVPGTVFRGHHI